MKFYTQYERPSLEECPHEEHADEGLVEVAGYRSTEELVNQLLQAGENLQAFREAEYRWDEEIPEDAPAFRNMSELDARLAADRQIEEIRNRRKYGNIGRDSRGSADSLGLGNKPDESAGAEGSESSERGADEAKLAKG